MVEIGSRHLWIGTPTIHAGAKNDSGFLLWIDDDLGGCCQIGLHSFLEVERQAGVRPQIGDPIPGEAGLPGQVQLSVEIVEIDFDSARLASLTTGRGDVDDPASPQSLFYRCVHTGLNPLAASTIPGAAIGTMPGAAAR